jgi:phage gp29-like protein
MRVERDLKKYQELILPVFTQWSKVGSVSGILADIENGQFYDGALLWSQMMRDDRCRATMDVRLNGVLGCPMHMEPHKDTANGQSIADDALASWPDMAPRSELKALYEWGIGLGVGLARREWNGWQPTIKTWHPGGLWYNLSDDTYYLRLANGQIPILPDDPNWVLFTPYGHKYARTSGLIRSAAMLFLARQWAFRDRARHSERHGMPFLVGTTPAEADVDDKKAYKASLAAVGSETVIVAPQGTDGNKWGVELIEAKSNSHEVFSAQIDHLDAAIAILFLGQSDSTQQKSGLGGKENAGGAVRGDIKRFDAVTLQDLGRLIMTPWATFNHGKDKTPSPVWEVDPPEDGNQKALELSTLGDAISKLASHGLDIRQLLEQSGVPLLTPEQAKAQKEQAMADAQAMMKPAKEPGSDKTDTQDPADDTAA